MFKILKKDPRSWARAGVIETSHGIIETPAYAIVGTHGQVKCLPAEMLSSTKTQVIISNTYHLWQNHPPNRAEPDLAGQTRSFDYLPKVHDLLKVNLPIITDSGGFQVFSLGFGREHRIGKVSNIFPRQTAPLENWDEQAELGRQGDKEKNLARITEEGVFFTISQGEEQFLGPGLSIRIQEALGADLILAFDECTSPRHSYEYTRQALNRTHRWAKICLENKTSNKQLLYGVVQGGEFQDLREESARFIASLPFQGIAIGGSLGKSKSDAFDVLKWTIPLLGEERPRHFLGIGQVEDLFESVERGVDTFDCVIPTREARHGRIWTSKERYDITKTVHKTDPSSLEFKCQCPSCLTISRAQLHALFKAKDWAAGQYATIHNVYFFNHLMEQIREAIKERRLFDFKKSFLAQTKSR